MRGGGRPRDLAAPGLGRLFAFAAVVVAAIALAACAIVDPLSRDICVAVVPALEPNAGRIEITAVADAPERPGNVVVDYRLDEAGIVRTARLTCAFGDAAMTGDRRDLVGVRTDRGDLTPSRLFFLKRFWLGDPTARAEGLARLVVTDDADPRGLVRLPPGAALILQHVLDAAAPSALYALLALACSLVYGLVGRILFVFGDIATLGAFAALIGALLVEAAGIAATGPLVVVALLTAVVVTAGWGAVLGRTVFRPLAFRTAQPMLVAAVGLSIGLSEFVARAQGVRDHFLRPLWNRPLLVADGPFTVMITPMRLVIVGLVLAIVVAVLGVWPRTRLGRAWRAVADDALMARLLGIDPARVLVATFTLAAALAAIAGAILTLGYGATSFHMGTVLGLKAVVAAVIGGIGSLPGAVLGGLLVGAIETAWSAAFGIEWRDAVVLALLVVVVLFRPAGLLGTAAALEEKGR